MPARKGEIMARKIRIFGKNAWPHTGNAREAYEKSGSDVEYIDVKQDSAGLNEMLKLSDGVRKVPVIVEEDKVTIGYQGKGWGV